MTLSIGRAPIDEQRLRASGLLPSEYESIVARLGREIYTVRVEANDFEYRAFGGT